jgi:hypothetical protein
MRLETHLHLEPTFIIVVSVVVVVIGGGVHVVLKKQLEVDKYTSRAKRRICAVEDLTFVLTLTSCRIGVAKDFWT